MELSHKKCIPCEGGIPPLDSSGIIRLLKQINGWECHQNKLTKTFRFINYRHTIDFLNRVANLAEEENHHPDLFVGYGICRVELFTHALNGLSENDFILAAKIDTI